MNRSAPPLLAAAIAGRLSLAVPQATTAEAASRAKSKPMSEILEASPAGDWRPAGSGEHASTWRSPAGRVVIELAPEFAPLHADRTSARWCARSISTAWRSSARTTTTWCSGAIPRRTRQEGQAARHAPGPARLEYTAPIAPDKHFTRLPDADGYAPEVGFSNGFPVGHDPKAGAEPG
jgi:hypothetical protein